MNFKLNFKLLEEASDALDAACEYKRAGMHKSAYAHSQLAARKIEQALAEGWADRDQLTVRGELMTIPNLNVRPIQLD